MAKYFQRHAVPFSRAQFFRYRRRLAANGLSGLSDGRQQGNRRKLTPDVEAFVRGIHHADPRASLRQMCDAVLTEYGMELDRSTLSRLFSRLDEPLTWPPPAAVERISTPCGGFEILAALALHLGWVQHTVGVIQARKAAFRRSTAYAQERVSTDQKGRNALGQLTAQYNRRRDVREKRFASIEEKRADKNYSRMGLFQVSRAVLEQKCLAILALPLITLNGATRSANGPLGNSLEHFCGYNYQHHTVDKFLRELKYLGVSDALLCQQIPFWQEHWKPLEEESSQAPFLCYYVDGNTKPLWSSQRVKKNKVTMLGRVMGCLEQVFIHDGYGHPVYMQTYAGKGPVGEEILGLFEKIEGALEGAGAQLKVRRVIVMDAASNGVGTLRAFAQQDRYHYITALDDNQWNPRKIREEGRPRRYDYGEATLRDCRLELEDSREKGYLVVVRAVRIDWDHGKTTVLITSLPKEVIGTSLVVKAYFDRWPFEELQFRTMKSFACLNRVAGYGKAKTADLHVESKQTQLQGRITELRHELKVPLKDLAGKEEELVGWVAQERRLRVRGEVVAGQRVLNAVDQGRLKAVAREIGRCQREIKEIQAECEGLKKLRGYEESWLGLQGKEVVYRIDVELDQLMTYFRIGLVNLSSWFLHQCMEKSVMSLAQFLHTILLLPAEIELGKEVRRITLRRNMKDAEGMKKLEAALTRLNALQVKDLGGRRIEFTISLN